METYQGMHHASGNRIRGEAHLQQSIRDIIMTPIGSRVMRRDYGCGLFYLLDQPINGPLIGMIQAQIINALIRFEPRVIFSQVQVLSAQPGELVLSLKGNWRETGQPVLLANLPIDTSSSL
ncbi:MAG: GPW/gp25 family protein [Bacteroidota bacterium]